MEELKEHLVDLKQEHLLRFYEKLDDEKKKSLEADIKSINWEKIEEIKQTCKHKNGQFITEQRKTIDDKLLSPLPEEIVGSTMSLSKDTLDRYHSIGIEYISKGKVAALVLAGGQGTRLGVDYPKGTLDVGLPSHKSLFHLQAERVLKLANKTGRESIIKWYIMTSPATHGKTVQFFFDKNYFGIKKENVVFFQQSTLPAFDFGGKIFLEDKHKISKSPDGNGGLFESFHRNGILEDMRYNGVEFLHVYCVDNVLVKVCDPTFIGFCIDKRADAGSKVVEKTSPTESVGTICRYKYRFKVIEYSEISNEVALRRDKSTGKLVFNAGNICEQFFSVNFLESIDPNKLPYHIAIKRIPHVSLENGELVNPREPNGVKFEKFIFDFLEFTDKFVVWEVDRDEEFSPIKNPDGTTKDNPASARSALMRLFAEGKIDEP